MKLELNHNSIMAIRKNRFWDSIMEMAKIGPGKSGGSNRQALTDEDNQGRELFCRWCKEAGLAISVDQMGTIFATREGTEPDLPGVYIGSHLDTQPTGGKFDGVLGVLAALEVVRTLNEYQVKTKRSIIVTNWTNEEGSRFVPSMLASAVFSGVYSLEYAYGLKDREGITLHHELKRTGWLGTEPVGARKIHSYVEYHIEQGPILESKHKSVGVVTHCQGQSWLEVTLTGRSAHTGSTPMNMRKNACLAMARIINIVDDIAMKLQPNVAGSVGQINMLPNSRNALPETAIFTIDLRAVDKDKFITLCELVETEVQKIAQEHNVLCSIERIGHYEPIEFDKQITEVVKNSAIQLGYDFMEITSGAGHDATWISGVAPTSMIFCPCVDGISHHELEDITQEWAESGANVLLHTAITLSNA